MKRVMLPLALLVVVMTWMAPAKATRSWIGGQSAPPDACRSEWIRSIDAPCETMSETPRVRCDLDRPYYEIWYRFRWYNGTEWSQWWLYYRWFKRAPSKVCAH